MITPEALRAVATHLEEHPELTSAIVLVSYRTEEPHYGLPEVRLSESPQGTKEFLASVNALELIRAVDNGSHFSVDLLVRLAGGEQVAIAMTHHLESPAKCECGTRTLTIADLLSAF